MPVRHSFRTFQKRRAFIAAFPFDIWKRTIKNASRHKIPHALFPRPIFRLIFLLRCSKVSLWKNFKRKNEVNMPEYPNFQHMVPADGSSTEVGGMKVTVLCSMSLCDIGISLFCLQRSLIMRSIKIRRIQCTHWLNMELNLRSFLSSTCTAVLIK